MSIARLFFSNLRINFKNLPKPNYFLIEGLLFNLAYKEMKEIFREKYKDYFYLVKFTREEENMMLDANFLRLIILDILSTEEYDLSGIAFYTNSHEDVVQEIISGCNTNPSAILLQKIIDLHQSVRAELYQTIFKKIIEEYLLIKSLNK